VNEKVKFVYLQGSYELIKQRLINRQGHFMSSELLIEQFSTLEEPIDAISIDISNRPEQIVKIIQNALGI
jgi:gluconate kinase